MVVPAKVAAQFGERLVQPMTSKAAANGIYGALRDASGIVAQRPSYPQARRRQPVQRVARLSPELLPWAARPRSPWPPRSS